MRYQTAPRPVAGPMLSRARTPVRGAGDGNRTRPRSLEGFCAATTLRPRAAADDTRGGTWSRRRRLRPRAALLGRHGALVVGQRGRRPRAEPVVARAVQGDHGARQRLAQRRAGERDEPGVLGLAAEALQRHGARGGAPDRFRVLAQRLGVEVARRQRDHGNPERGPLARPAARVALDGRPSGARVRHAGQAVVRRQRHVDDRSPAAGTERARNRQARHQLGPPTFSRCTARQPLGSIASAGTKYWPPALLTSASRRPKRSSAKPTMRSAETGSRTSPATQEAPMAEAAEASTSSRRPQITTDAPQRTSSAAAARPSPVPPPVTSTTRPSSRPGAETSERAGMGGGSVIRGRNESDAGIPRPMQIPGVHIETLQSPTRYTSQQIEKACAIAAMLNRGKLVLVEPPKAA